MLQSPARRLGFVRPTSPSVSMERARLQRQSPTQWHTMPARDAEGLMQSVRQGPAVAGGQNGHSNHQTRASNAIRTLQLIAQGKQHVPAPAWIPSPGRKDRTSDTRDRDNRGMSQSPVMGLEGRAVRGSGSWQQVVQQQNRAAVARHSWHAGSGTPVRMSQRRASHRDRASETWSTGSTPSSPFPGASPRSPLGSPLYARVNKGAHSDTPGSRDWARNPTLQKAASKDHVIPRIHETNG